MCHISETVLLMIMIFGAILENDDIPRCFLHFQNFDFFSFLGGRSVACQLLFMVHMCKMIIQRIMHKKSGSVSRTLPFVIFDKKVPFFSFLGNSSPKVPFFEYSGCCP